MTKDYLYTEQVQIPSKGLLNPEIPEGKITLRCVEIKDQKYISGTKNLNKNISIALLERCIIEPENIDINKLTQIDLFYLLLKLRVLSYGSKYSYLVECPYCGKTVEVDTDLSNIPVQPINENFKDNLVVTLPRRGDTVYTHIITQGDRDFIDRETERLKNKFKDMEEDPSVTISIAKVVDKIVLKEPLEDGTKELTDYIDILKYVESLTDMDAIAIDTTADSVGFGVIPIVPSACNSCGKAIATTLRTTAEFFRPRFNK